MRGIESENFILFQISLYVKTVSLLEASTNISFHCFREGLIPGPQVPPRNPQETSPGSHGDRVLSVSGKKRCSHCKEELGKKIL